MKKTNSSEENLDDADELRKKKLKTDVVTDQMVPVPESCPLRKEEEREEVESKTNEKSDEISLLSDKQCKDTPEMRDTLDLESMYEDVNSPEDFDDYDDDLVQKCSSAEKIDEDSKTDEKPENSVVEDSAKSTSISQEPKTCIDNDSEVDEKIDRKLGNCIDIAENTSLKHEQENCIAADTAKNVNLNCEEETFIADDITETVDDKPENCITDSAENASSDNVENYMAEDTEEDVILDHELKNYIANNSEEIAILDQASENFIADDSGEIEILNHEQENHAAEDIAENSRIDHKRENYIAEDSDEIASVVHEPESYVVKDSVENASVVHKQEKYIIEEIAVGYEEEGSNVSCKTVISKTIAKESAQDLYIVEDCSLPSSDASLVRRDESPLGGPAPTICSSASMEEDLIDCDAEGDEDGGERDGDNVGYSLNTENKVMHDPVESQVDYTVTATGRGIVPEVEDVTCDSGGDTVLVMNREVCSENFCVRKQSKLCTVEEIGYPDPLNTIESVDEMIFHPRNSVIETANASASLHANDRGMKCSDNRFLCELPVRETMGGAKYHGSYANVGINSVFPKRVYNTVHISSVPESSENELYGYNSSIQNMMFCRNNTVIDASTVPVASNVNGLETYSFHRVPVESSSCIRNMNDSYGHSNPGFCPVIQNSKFEFSNSNITSVRKLPTEEDFMRRIEKTLFESKIENKIEDSIDSKYKSEVDLSLPLKKRLRTLAAISNSITCTPEKFVAPKEESFPSYPAKPMISIAELEFTEALIPKPGNIYRDSYK